MFYIDDLTPDTIDPFLLQKKMLKKTHEKDLLQCSGEMKIRSSYAQTELNEGADHQTTGSALDASKNASDVNVWEAIQNISKKCNVEYTEAFQFLLDNELNESKAVEEISKVWCGRKCVNKTARDDNSNLEVDTIYSCKTLQFNNVLQSKMAPHLIHSGDSFVSSSSSMMLSPCTSGTEVQLNDFALSSRSTEGTISDEGDINITLESTDSSIASDDSNVCKIARNMQCPYPNVNHLNVEVNTQGEANWNGPPAYYQYPYDNPPAMFFPNGYMVHPAQNYYPMYGYGPTIHPSLCNINVGKHLRHQGINGFGNLLYIPCYPPQYNSFPLWAVPRQFPFFVYGPGHIHIPGPGS